MALSLYATLPADRAAAAYPIVARTAGARAKRTPPRCEDTKPAAKRYDRNPMHPKVSIKRAYEEPSAGDGYRVLVDRVWPRGMRKDALALDEWAKELAPSAALRTWFGHNVERWEAFRARYEAELQSPEARTRLRALLDAAGDRPITLVYSARDERHNQAVVLRETLARMRR